LWGHSKFHIVYSVLHNPKLIIQVPFHLINYLKHTKEKEEVILTL
jgi:hypothetical protein